MMPIWAHDDENFHAISRFVSTRIWGETRPFLGNTALGVVSGGKLIAGVVFSNFDPHAGVIELSAASETPRWLTRGILWQMYDYAFNQLGCQAAVHRVDPQNTRLGRIFSAYGCEKYDIPRLRGRDKAETIFILGDDVWRANGFHKENENG